MQQESAELKNCPASSSRCWARWWSEGERKVLVVIKPLSSFSQNDTLMDIMRIHWDFKFFLSSFHWFPTHCFGPGEAQQGVLSVLHPYQLRLFHIAYWNVIELLSTKVCAWWVKSTKGMNVCVNGQMWAALWMLSEKSTAQVSPFTFYLWLEDANKLLIYTLISINRR